MSQKGINSVEVAMRLLNTFTAPDADMSLTALAAAAQMHPSKAHRYLVSLIRSNYVDQSRSTGRYTLGPQAMSLGLAAMRKLNVLRIGEDIVSELRDRTAQTISLVVLGNQGPTIARVSDANTPIIISVRVGSVLPLLSSTNGQIFIAYAAPARIQWLIDRELRSTKRNENRNMPRTQRAVDRLGAAVRKQGMSRTRYPIAPGVVSLSAPVFDHRGELACSLTVVGSIGNLDLAWRGEPAAMLLKASREFSEALGAAPR